MNYKSILLKLCLVLGLGELIGLIQLPNNESDFAMAFNLIVGSVYAILRSLRGCFVYVMFIMSKQIKRFKLSIERQLSFKSNSHSESNNNSISASKM